MVKWGLPSQAPTARPMEGPAVALIVSDTDIIVMMARRSSRHKPRRMLWPQTDVFKEGPPLKCFEAWVVQCPSVQAAAEQAKRWPFSVDGCRVIRRFKNGRWLTAANGRP